MKSKGYRSGGGSRKPVADGENMWRRSVHRVIRRWRSAGRRGWNRVTFQCGSASSLHRKR